MKRQLGARVVAEFLGTGFLVVAVVGSGIMAERLCGGNVGLALLANTIATGAALVALILTFGPISGAQFNPVVTVADAMAGGTAWSDVFPYVAGQVRPTSGVYFSSCSRRNLAALERICRDVWSAVRDLGLQPGTAEARCFCSGMLHHVRVLVYGINVVRKSGSDGGARAKRYVRGNSAGKRSGVCCGSVSWRNRGDFGISLVGAEVGDRAWTCAGTNQRQNRVNTAAPSSLAGAFCQEADRSVSACRRLCPLRMIDWALSRGRVVLTLASDSDISESEYRLSRCASFIHSSSASIRFIPQAVCGRDVGGL
jgi:Major intrinsic protein